MTADAERCLDLQQSELVESYAVGALDASEAARFERHLAVCPACRRAAAAYQDLLAGLPLALAAAAPSSLPPELRNRVLSAARPNHPARPGPRTWQRFTLVAAALLVALAGVWGVQQGVALARERAQLRAEYAALVNQQETVLEVVDGRNTVKRNLAPPEGGGPTAPYGKLYTRPDLASVVAMAGRLPAPPSGAAYHLWVTPAGQPGLAQLAGVLVFNQGFGLLTFDAPSAGPAYEAAWITVQSPGGTSPAGPVVLRWQA